MSEPLWLTLARGDLGVSETPGPKSNPEILEMFKDSGHPEISSEDTAWCAAYAGAMLHRAGINPTGSLMARSYLKWGDKLDAPKAGCVAVLWRGHPDSDTGHVGFVVSFDADSIELLGGNQGAAGVVSIEHFPRSRVLGWRWPRADETPAEGGAGPGAKSPSTSEKPLQIKAAPLGGSGAVLAGKSTKGTTTMNPLSILTSLIGALVPTVKNSPSPVTGAGTTVSAVTTITNAIGMVIGAILASRGVDAGAASTIGGGVAVFVAALLNQLHITGGANVNTVVAPPIKTDA